MAKSIRISEIEAHRAHPPVNQPLSRGSYWEHWFEGESQSLKPQANHPLLDEHGIWEKAVNFEILAMDKEKF